MSRLITSMLSLLLIGALAMPTLGQERRPPRPPQDSGGGAGGGGPGGPDGPPPDGPGGPDGGGPMGMGGGPMGGGFGRGPGGQGMMRPEMQKMEMLRGYIELVDRFTRLSRDPGTAGIAAVISASDMLKRRGPDTAINYFTKTLPDVKNEAVQRAIRIQLADLYKAAGQEDKAIEQLEILMKGAPAGSPGTNEPRPPAQ